MLGSRHLLPFYIYSILSRASLDWVFKGDESNMLKLRKRLCVLHKDGRSLWTDSKYICNSEQVLSNSNHIRMSYSIVGMPGSGSPGVL